MRKLDQIQEDMEKAHERVKDKVERQIPNDVRFREKLGASNCYVFRSELSTVFGKTAH